MMENNKIVLSISLLMSGREETRKCLESLRPLMEAIPCELILVDTGCDDEKRTILEEYTDIIIPFEWCDDFAKARNTGLMRATGEWFMFMDDDEWFTDINPLIDFFITEEYKNYNCANYKMKNYFNEEGTRYKEFYASRLIKRTKETIFKGKIHEYLSPFTGKLKNIETEMEHYGYVFKSQKEKHRHAQRNVVLLLEEIEKKPYDLRIATHLLNEYYGLEEYDSIIEYCKKLLEKCDELSKNNILSEKYISLWFGEILGAYLWAHDRKFQHREIKEILNKYCMDSRLNELAKMNMHMYETIMSYEEKDYGNVIKVAEKFLNKYKELKDNNELLNDLGPLFLGRNLREQEYRRISFIVIKAACSLKIDKTIEKKVNDLEFDNDIRFIDGEFVNKLLEHVLSKEKYEEKFLAVFKKIINSEYCLKEIFTYVMHLGDKNDENYNEESEEKLQLAVEYFSKIDNPHWFFSYMKILDYKNNGDKEECIKNITYLFKCVVDIFNIDNRVWDIATEVRIDFDSVIGNAKFHLWQEGIDRWIDDTTLEDIEHKASLVEMWKGAQDYRYLYFEMKVKEGIVRYTDASKISFSELENMIFDYATTAYNYYVNVYNERVFIEHREVLPRDCELVLALLEIINFRKVEDNDNVIECIRNNINTYTPFNGVLKVYAQKLGEYIKERKSSVESKDIGVNEELSQLAYVLKIKAREFIENGAIQEAKVVLNQIIQCVPSDKEAKEILSMID